MTPVPLDLQPLSFMLSHTGLPIGGRAKNTFSNIVGIMLVIIIV